MKRVDKYVILVVILFVALALLRTTLEVAAQLAPFIAGLGVIYMIARFWYAGKLEFLKAAIMKMVAKPSPETAERK